MRDMKIKCYIWLSLFAPLTSAAPCLEDWKVNLEACDYETLKAALQDILPSDCTHDATIELQEALGVSTEGKVQRKIAGQCSQGYLPWNEITKEGDVFDKEYFDGGTSFNEERESTDEFGLKEHNLKVAPGAKIRNVNDVVSETQGISFPSDMSNFEDCDLRAVMCCFVQDRQANDNNGNCATPYNENCVDSDPADNTDICYVDMERAPTSSRTASGFAIFEEEEEGDSHCHGFAWANDPSDKSARYKGNNLFYVSLYDHFYQRGYTRNVPGAPMCGCLEKMPVVTRSDCTQIDVDEDVEVSFEGGNLDVTFNNLEIDFNSCQAPNDNNDLEAYYERITSEGKATEEELKEVQKHLVGETYCREAIDSFLDDKNLQEKPACRYGNPETCGCKDVLQADYRGDLSTTISGKECQRWDEQEPHSHNRKRQRYPNEGLVSNYCRNPDDTSGGAWCYTTDPDTRWEYCNVEICPEEVADASTLTCGSPSLHQADYRGTLSTTKSGRTCQQWHEQTPHEHNKFRHRLRHGLSSNYCRNPSGSSGGAWCYTTDPDKRWEFCNVEDCAEDA